MGQSGAVVGAAGAGAAPVVPPVVPPLTPPPTVTAVTPANGATAIPINRKLTATFSKAMDASTINTATFLVNGPGGAAIAGTVTFAGTTATFTPTSNLPVSTLITTTITTGAKDTTGIALASNFVWSFTTGLTSDAPTVISTVPINGATGVPINSKVTATFSKAMDAATITGTTFTVTGPGTTPVAGLVTYVTDGATALFTPTANLLLNTTYTATVTVGARDPAGNPLATNFVWTFKTGATADVTPPTVIATTPANGATAVPINIKPSATFSKPMDPLTITTSTFTLSGPGATGVAGAVTYATVGSTAVFTPTSSLAANTTFTATITTGAKDLAGNPLASNFVWTFTTGAAADTTPPTVISTNPLDGAVGVAINASVNATFSEALDPLTITTATYVLTSPGGAIIPSTVSYSATTNIASLVPTSALTANTKYTATVTGGASGVKDLAGNALVNNKVWTFTTGAQATPPPPTLGTATPFGSMGGGAGMTNQGLLTVVNGDIGTTGASTTMTGFHDTAGNIYTETPLNVGTVNGSIFTAPPTPGGTGTGGNAATFAVATQALADANAAFINLSPAAMPGGSDPGAGQLGGLTLPPGIYKSAAGTFLITGSDLTLDAQGNTNATFVFQMASSLTVGAPGAPRSIILINGAQAKNVFWQVGSSATINGAGGGTMVGTIIASAGVSFSTAGNVTLTTLNGRALGLNASVTLVNTIINVPAP